MGKDDDAGEKDVSALAVIERLHAQLKEKDDKIEELSRKRTKSDRVIARNQEKHAHNHDTTPNVPEKDGERPHYVGAFQKFCPSCGKENLNFKNEVSCPNCKVPLGSKEEASKAKACWNCGKDPNTKASVRCVNCKTPLGTKEEAEKLESCPTCHGKHAEVITV